jgi:hypothetical protein
VVVTAQTYVFAGVECEDPAALADAMSRRPLVAARHVALGRVQTWLDEHGFHSTAVAVRVAAEDGDDPILAVIEVDAALRGADDRRWGGEPLTAGGLAALCQRADDGDDDAAVAVDLMTPDRLAAVAARTSNARLQAVSDAWRMSEQRYAELAGLVPADVAVAHRDQLDGVERQLRRAAVDPPAAARLRGAADGIAKDARHLPWFAELRRHREPASWVLQTAVGGAAAQRGEPLAQRARRDRSRLVGRLLATAVVIALAGGAVSALVANEGGDTEQDVTSRPAPGPAPPPAPAQPAPAPAAVAPAIPDDCYVAAFITRRVRGDALADRATLRQSLDIPAEVVESQLVPGWDGGQYVVVAPYADVAGAQQAVTAAQGQGYDGIPVRGDAALCGALR